MKIKWITVKEAATIMGVDESLVRRMARDGGLRARRFGRAWQIAQQDAASYKPVRQTGPKELGVTGA